MSSSLKAMLNFSSAEKVMFSPWVPSLNVVSYRKMGSIIILRSMIERFALGALRLWSAALEAELFQASRPKRPLFKDRMSRSLSLASGETLIIFCGFPA
jgi:hypothetical protein